MSNPSKPESQPNPESNESFEDMLKEFEQTHSRKAPEGGKQIEGTVVAVSAESVFLDIGYKTEGILPLAPFQGAGETVKGAVVFRVARRGEHAVLLFELDAVGQRDGELAFGALHIDLAGLQSDFADLVQSIDASSQEADKLISSLAASDNKN